MNSDITYQYLVSSAIILLMVYIVLESMRDTVRIPKRAILVETDKGIFRVDSMTLRYHLATIADFLESRTEPPTKRTKYMDLAYRAGRDLANFNIQNGANCGGIYAYQAQHRPEELVEICEQLRCTISALDGRCVKPLPLINLHRLVDTYEYADLTDISKFEGYGFVASGVDKSGVDKSGENSDGREYLSKFEVGESLGLGDANEIRGEIIPFGGAYEPFTAGVEDIYNPAHVEAYDPTGVADGPDLNGEPVDIIIDPNGIQEFASMPGACRGSGIARQNTSQAPRYGLPLWQNARSYNQTIESCTAHHRPIESHSLKKKGYIRAGMQRGNSTPMGESLVGLIRALGSQEGCIDSGDVEGLRRERNEIRRQKYELNPRRSLRQDYALEDSLIGAMNDSDDWRSGLAAGSLDGDFYTI